MLGMRFSLVIQVLAWPARSPVFYLKQHINQARWQSWNPSMGEVGARGSVVPGRLCLHSKFKARLGYARLKSQKTKKALNVF